MDTKTLLWQLGTVLRPLGTVLWQLGTVLRQLGNVLWQLGNVLWLGGVDLGLTVGLLEGGSIIMTSRVECYSELNNAELR